MFNAQSFSPVSTGFTSGTSMLPTVSNVDQVSKMPIADTMKEVFFDIRDGITDLGSIFSTKISGLNSHLAFRLETLNTTMTTIGKILADDLDLEKESFDDMREKQEKEDRNKSLEDEDKDDEPKSIFGSMFDGIKGAFGSIIDFLTPKSDLAKIGLAGLLVGAVFLFRDKIEAAFTTIFTYLGSLKDAFSEDGFVGVRNKLGKDIKDNIINPSLSALGLELKEDGSVGRIQGSFLDKIDPFTGPTNIFKTLNAFRTGLNPYDNNSKMYPEWYYKGFMENLNNLLTPEDPDMLVNAAKGAMTAITKGISDFFLGAEKTMPGVGEYREQSGMSQMKDQMMENFRNNMQGIKDFFHDEDGNLFGIDFKALTDLLPTIQEIAESIYNALPQWARPDTLQEKNIDRDVERLKDIDFFNKDYIGKSVITRSNIDQASPEELKSLLSKESDDLKPADIQFIENKILEKEKMMEITKTEKLPPSIIEKKEMITKTESLEKEINEKSNTKSSGEVITVVTDAKRVDASTTYNSSSHPVIEMRDSTLEMTAFEMNNFFRNRT